MTRERVQRLMVVGGALALALLLTGCGFDRFEARGWAGLAVQDDVLYVSSGEGRLFALNVAGDAEGTAGRPALLYNPYPAPGGDGLGPVYSAPVLARSSAPAETLYVATYGDPEQDDDLSGNLFALDAQTGGQAWVTQVPGRVVAAPTLVGDTLLVASTDGALHALALGDDPTALPGRRWPAFIGDDRIWGRPAVDGGSVYFGTLGHTVYAVDLAEGKERWRASVGGAVVGSPLVVDGVVYVGALDRTLYAFSAENGRELWRFAGDGWFWASPVEAEGVIYAATLQGSLYALARDGKPLWPEPAQADGPIVAAPVPAGASVAVSTTENTIHLFNRTGGHEEWATRVNAQIRAEAAGHAGVLYVIDGDGVVHALHTGQRRQLWSYPTDN